MTEKVSPVSSLLSSKISKSGRILVDSSNWQIEEFQEQLQQVSELYETLFKDLIIDSFSIEETQKTAKKFFNKDSINFAAIDGTEYTKQFFDMVIFYAGAYSCFGSLSFTDGIVRTKYDDKFLGNDSDVSSCLPIFLTRIPEIDQTFDSSRENTKSLTEESIIENTNIPSSIMAFSEFFLAYKIALSKKADVILMDRSIANTYSLLIRDTSKIKTWDAYCSLLGYEINGDPLDKNELKICRHNLINNLLDLPPSRGTYLRYLIIYKILAENEPVSLDSLCKLIGIDDKRKTNRINKYLDIWIEDGVIKKESEKYAIDDRYKNSWNRVKQLVIEIGDKIFYHEKDPFIINKTVNGEAKKEWITTTDLAFLTLFTLYMLIEECWKNNILLIGITKDTAAHDFKNHLLSIGLTNSLWNFDKDINEKIRQDLEGISYSDRMLFQSLSLTNYDKIDVPWSSIEYDASFIMSIPDLKGRNGYVSGAVKNKITTNKLFLRSFIQLQQAKTDCMLRSNVLSIDRLVYPGYDINEDNILHWIHEYFGEEKIDFLLYKNNSIRNEMQNLMISILKSMSSPSVAEAFGHNKALYIADKVAKWHNEEFRKIVDSTTTLISCNKNLKNFLFYMNSFRERRQQFESNRKF